MKIFRVEVLLSMADTIVVHANDGEDAERAAVECVQRRLFYDNAAKPDDVRGRYVVRKSYVTNVIGPIKEERDENRPDTYVCGDCSVSSPKRAFGPGWLKCPKCGGRPLPIS